MFNLSFLNSSALIFSLTALVPLLIYLFAKKRPPRIIFSSIKFIQATQKKQKKKMNLKNLLLLIIRMLIILFTVLAISRPAVKLESLKGSAHHPPTAVAIILDNSYSMDFVVDTQTELDKGQQIAEEIGNMLTSDDVCAMFSLDKGWNDQNSGLNFGAFPSSLLHSISITPEPQDIRDVILAAENLLKESDIANREIYLITDLQDHKLPQQLDTPLFLIKTSEVEERSNLSVESASLGSNLVNRGIDRQIDFTVVNNSRKVVEDVICTLNLDGNTAAENVSDLQAGERLQNSFLISLEKPGWHSGYVSVRDERLIYDNRFYFAFFYNHEPKIAVLTSKDELPPTLQTMLEIYTGKNSNIHLINENYTLDKLSQYDNLIVWAVDDWDGQLQFILSNLTRQGRKILYIADPQLPETARNYLSNEFDLRFERLSDDQKPKKITQINQYHPVAIRLDGSRSASLKNLWLTGSSANIIMQAESYPVALENEGNILWLFAIDELRSSFLVDANYPVLAYNSLMYTASSGKGNRQLASGMLFLPKSEPLTLPGGKTLQTGGRRIKLSQPGLYYEGSQLIPLAVNLDYSESRFQELSLPDDQPLITLCEQNWQEDIFQARYGFELWKYLAGLALLLFALEMLIVKSEERKS